MKKIRTLLKAPLLVSCGYGQHARQILQSLLKDGSFDVYCENINWGNCSYLTEDTDERKTIRQLIQKKNL